ncbi:hypothetical protein B0H17DRAFT_859591, partial [Mycena rosella]
DTRITALREELGGLEAFRAALKAHYDDCGGLLAPIRRLPSELLVKIFELVSTEVRNHVSPASSSDEAILHLSQPHLLALSSVCSRFYTLVMHTCTLWNIIRLDTLERPSADGEIMMRLLKRILDR